MGQRSQIYIRFNTQDEKKMIVPRYYQWNFGTRMISRARHTLEWLKGNAKHLYDPSTQEKLRRIMDVNFDYKDVVLGQDIIKEWKECGEDPEFNSWIFGEDNDDGKLLVDVCIKYPKKREDWLKDFKIKFKYAFLTASDDSAPMDGNGYMQWDTYYGDDNNGEKKWEENEYIRDEVRYTKQNIAYISKKAKLMTPDEVEEFMDYDYATDMKLIELPFC